MRICKKVTGMILIFALIMSVGFHSCIVTEHASTKGTKYYFTVMTGNYEGLRDCRMTNKKFCVQGLFGRGKNAGDASGHYYEEGDNAVYIEKNFKISSKTKFYEQVFSGDTVKTKKIKKSTFKKKVNAVDGGYWVADASGWGSLYGMHMTVKNGVVTKVQMVLLVG